MNDSPSASASDRKAVPQVLVIAPALIPSVTIGILRPMLTLERAGVLRWRLCFDHDWTVSDIRRADVVVFCRNQSESSLVAMLTAKHEGKKVVYEIDDNFFEIPIDSAVGRQHRQPALLHTVRRMFEMADVTRVYNSRMADLAASFGARVHFTRVYFDASLIAGRNPKRSSEKIRIAFATGRSADVRLELSLEQALVDVIAKYPDRVEIHYWRAPGEILRGRKQVKLNQGVSDYDKFIRSFFDEGYDIGLAPLLSTPFYESKTNTKFREYGACGVAGVYSRAAPYFDCVIDGGTGLVVENTRDGWRDGILRLIENDDLRRAIAAKARSEVMSNYSYASFVSVWRDSLRQAMNSPVKDLCTPPFCLDRNIVVPAGSSLGKPLKFQDGAVRESRWRIARFSTTVVEEFSRIPPGSTKALTIQVMDGCDQLNHGSLTTLKDAGVQVICDVRKCSRTEIDELIDTIAMIQGMRIVAVCSPDQVPAIGYIGERGQLDNVEHSFYPRPQRLQTSFGYLVVVPKHNAILDKFSLAGGEGVWLELLDTTSVMHLADARFSEWQSTSVARRVLNRLPYNGLPVALMRAVLRRGTNNLYRLRWQYFRKSLPSDVSLERLIGRERHDQGVR